MCALQQIKTAYDTNSLSENKSKKQLSHKQSWKNVLKSKKVSEVHIKFTSVLVI